MNTRSMRRRIVGILAVPLLSFFASLMALTCFVHAAGQDDDSSCVDALSSREKIRDSKSVAQSDQELLLRKLVNTYGSLIMQAGLSCLSDEQLEVMLSSSSYFSVPIEKNSVQSEFEKGLETVRRVALKKNLIDRDEFNAGIRKVLSEALSTRRQNEKQRRIEIEKRRSLSAKPIASIQFAMTEPVFLAVPVSNEQIVTVDFNNVAKLRWHDESRPPVVLDRGRLRIISLVTSQKKNLIIGGTMEGMILFWDATSGKFLKEIKNESKRHGSSSGAFSAEQVRALALSEDSEFFSATSVSKILVFDTGVAEERFVLYGGQSGVLSPLWDFAVSPSHPIADYSLYKIADPKYLQMTKKRHLGEISAVTISRGSQRVATAGLNNEIIVRGIESGDLEFLKISGPKADDFGKIISIAFFDDDHKLIFSTERGAVYIVDLENDAAPFTQLRKQTESKTKLKMARNGTFAVAISTDGKASVWKLSDIDLAINLKDLANPENSVQFSDDHKIMTTFTVGNRLLIWDLSEF